LGVYTHHLQSGATTSIWARISTPTAGGPRQLLALAYPHPPTGFDGRRLLLHRGYRPAGEPPGNLLGAGINLVFEGNESDNETAAATTVSLGAVPDLAVSNVAAPATAISGQSLDVSWTVTNNGAASNSALPINDSVYLSLDQIFDPRADRYLGTVPRRTGRRASYTQSASLLLPSGLAGTFYVFVTSNATTAFSSETRPTTTVTMLKPCRLACRSRPIWWPARSQFRPTPWPAKSSASPIR